MTQTPDSNNGTTGEKILAGLSLDDMKITHLTPLTIHVEDIESFELENTPGLVTVISSKEKNQKTAAADYVAGI